MPNSLSQQTLSIVIPCYNEQEVIDVTYERLVNALDALDMRLELVFVDDGSSDQTANMLRRIQRFDPRVRVVLLARNFGHQLAATAGLDHATGDAVVLIDADLQDPPEVIPEMVARWQEGFDVVYGRRTDRAGESWFKLITAKVFYRFIRRIAETDIPADSGDFRLLDRKVVDALGKMPEQSRYLRGMVSWVGFRQVALPYKRDKRFAGTSKYPLLKMLKFATDGVLSFSLRPLRMATLLGSGLVAMSMLGLIGAIGLALGDAMLAAAVTATLSVAGMLSGVQLICIGILGEYVGRAYRQSQDRPLYLVQETLEEPSVPQLRIADAA